MMPYLQDKVPEVREIIAREGVDYLLQPVRIGHALVPRYTAELCLNGWELDEILVELKIDPTNPTRTL